MDNSKNETWADLFLRAKKAKRRDENILLFSIFTFFCTSIFSVAFLSVILIRLFIQDITGKIFIAGIFFYVVRYFSRNKLYGRAVGGGMEKPNQVSFGATFLFLGLIILPCEINFQNLEYFLSSIILFLTGSHLFYEGIKEGPLNRWDHYWRCKRGEN